VCTGPLAEAPAGLGCAACSLDYRLDDGIYHLGPSFAVNGASHSLTSARLRRLVDESAILGWDEAQQRFTSDVLSGRLDGAGDGTPIDGTPWERALDDVLDASRAGWKFLLDLHPGARVLFFGPSSGATPLALARGAGHVIVLDRDLERLQVTRRQAVEHGVRHLTCVRVVNPLAVPVPDGSVNLAIMPGVADWFAAVGGVRGIPRVRAVELFRELRRVLAPGGQAYVATDNRLGLDRLLRPSRRIGRGHTPRTLRRAAAAGGFARCRLFAPLPFRHKFHQILDLERGDAMNFSGNAYRTRGTALRLLIRAWDACNRGGALERQLYPYLPGFAAVLSTEPRPRSFAERILEHIGCDGAVVANYYVRAKGLAVIVAGEAGAGRIVRLPLGPSAERGCTHHHEALELLRNDVRIPATLRALFPRPVGQGVFAGQPYYVESALPGIPGRVYYARTTRRYERAILAAADALRRLRRATEVPVRIDAAEFERLCGAWHRDLSTLVTDEQRAMLDRVAHVVADTLLDTTLPLGWYHGDYDFANLLYGPDDSLRGILDFDLFEPRGLPLVDLMVLLARRRVRREKLGFGQIFLDVILPRALSPLEAQLLREEMDTIGADDRVYRALALYCWLEHLRLRRESWLVRSPRWRRENLDAVVDGLRSVL